MEYHIRLSDGSTLASFVNEYDRDRYLEVLEEDHPDVDSDYFTAVDDN